MENLFWLAAPGAHPQMASFRTSRQRQASRKLNRPMLTRLKGRMWRGPQGSSPSAKSWASTRPINKCRHLMRISLAGHILPLSIYKMVHLGSQRLVTTVGSRPVRSSPSPTTVCRRLGKNKSAREPCVWSRVVAV